MVLRDEWSVAMGMVRRDVQLMGVTKASSGPIQK
jgi:hypothetical protein